MQYCVPLAAAFTVLSLAPAGQASTWYVRTDGNNSWAGTNWASAKQTIQAAVDLATASDTVLVSNGLYATGCRVTPGYISSNRVVITKNILVQSVNGPEVTSIKGTKDGLSSLAGSLRCVYLSGGMVAGFTLTDGGAPGEGDTTHDTSGGGAIVLGGILSNCVITGCTAYGFGGGVLLDGTAEHCTLSSNQAASGGGVAFGMLTDCTVSYNRAANGGGAYLCSLSGCLLKANSADVNGGGASDSSSQNCTFHMNTAMNGAGGGMSGSTASGCWIYGNHALYGGGSSHGELQNCTLVANFANQQAGGSYMGTLRNCIVYENDCPIDPTYDNYCGSLFSYSCSTPLPDGTGNIDSPPLFRSYLYSNFRLYTNSPCINRGDNGAGGLPATDLDGNPRVMFGTVDMGAYECQVPTGYWQWIGAVTNGLTNATECAAGDGYPNLLKYAAGGTPTNADNLALLTGAIVTNRFAVQFNRNKNAYDTTIIVEGADTLINAVWQPLAVNFNGSWGNASNVTESLAGNPVAVTVTDTAPSPNRFLRVRVTLP